MWLSALNMTWMFCEVYWDLELELVKTSGGQLVAFGGGFGIWLPWALNPEIPVAASQWYLDCTGTPNRAKSYTWAAQVDLPRFLDGKWKHAVSHVLRVYEFGHGNASSRTSLIILVFGEFGTPGLGGTCSVLAPWCAACPSGEWAIVAGDSKEVWALRWRQIHLSHLNLSVSSTVCRLVNSVKTACESLKQQQDSSPSHAKPQPQKLPKRRLQNPLKRKRQEKIASSKENLSLEIWPWKTASESLKQQQDPSPSHAKPRKDCLQQRKP